MRESEELELAEMIISANKGVKEDQCSLATSYAEGSYGLKKDMIKAIFWWTKAAENNDAQSMKNLWYTYKESNFSELADSYKKKLENEAQKGNKEAIDLLCSIKDDLKDLEISLPKQPVVNDIADTGDKNAIPKTYSDIKAKFKTFLMTDWTTSSGDPLPASSASSYTSFMGKLVTLYSVDKNDDSLDKLPYFVVNDKEKFYSVVEDCKKYISSQKRSSSKEDKKNWNNRSSAFSAYIIFLAEYYNLDTEDEVEEESIPSENVTSDNSKEEYIGCIHPDTLSYNDLKNKFLSRLKTQGRYYPSYKIYFPIRIIYKIFTAKNDRRLLNWMLNDLYNMDILKNDGSAEKFSNIKEMEITKEGKLVVKLNNDQKFEAYTRTSDGEQIIPMFMKKQWSSATIDHKVAMENKIGVFNDKFTGLRNISDLLLQFVQEKGIKERKIIESNKEANAYASEFIAKYETELYNMRDSIMDDLNMMQLEYELMDGSENSKKGKNII